MRQAHTALLSLALGAGVSLAAAPPPRTASPTWPWPPVEAVAAPPQLSEVVAPVLAEAPPLGVASLEMLPAPKIAEDIAPEAAPAKGCCCYPCDAAPAKGCCKQCDAAPTHDSAPEPLP